MLSAKPATEYNRCNMILGAKPYIDEGCKITNTTFGLYNEIGKHSLLENVEFGDYSYAMEFCYLQNTIIKKFVNIAAMVRIGPTDHPMQRVTQHHFTYRRKLYGLDEADDSEFFANRAARRTIIGNDTWLGHGSIIMPDVQIGDGSVVGSGAIVTKDVPAYSIVVGSPARVIKMRFTDKVIEQLLAIRWWDWPDEQLRSRFSDFLLGGEQFAEKYYRG